MDARARPAVETGPQVLIMRANYCLLGLKKHSLYVVLSAKVLYFTSQMMNDLVNHIVVSVLFKNEIWD